MTSKYKNIYEENDRWTQQSYQKEPKKPHNNGRYNWMRVFALKMSKYIKKRGRFPADSLNKIDSRRLLWVCWGEISENVLILW